MNLAQYYTMLLDRVVATNGIQQSLADVTISNNMLFLIIF